MRYFLDPFGCVKNQVDAENMMACLNSARWSAVPDAKDADLIIVNSCGFIKSAKQESINAVLCWRKMFPDKKILLAGCLAQRYAKQLAESLPEADGFFGVDDISSVAAAVNLLFGNETAGADMKYSVKSGPSAKNGYAAPVHSRPLLSLPGSAYVKISEGCGNCCSYCAIPLIRGPLRCRPAGDIVEECRGLLARGIHELCIIAQDVCSYRSGDCGLPELLRAIAEIPGQFWVRLLYMHPDNFPPQVLDVMERDLRFLPYFDIPFQHASHKILAAMNRQGNAEQYLSLAAGIRNRIPDAVIRSTFLVGFPGETDDDFSALAEFQERLRPDWLGCFSYSREEETAAYAMKAPVPKKTAAARKREIENRQVTITEECMDRFTGRLLDVLLEERFSGEELWLGRFFCHAPEVDGAAVVLGAGSSTAAPGGVVRCKVIARRGFDLEAAPVLHS
jgi:ribosomal protein S12 methylthiotransferase